MDKKPSNEFLERTKLQEQDKELIEIKHRFKMEELAFERETNRIFHEQTLERGRIKRAEDRKAFLEQRGYGGRR